MCVRYVDMYMIRNKAILRAISRQGHPSMICRKTGSALFVVLEKVSLKRRPNP